MGIIANWIAAILFFVLTIAAIVGTLVLFFNQERSVGKSATGVLVLVLALVFGAGWLYAATHRVVPYNARWIVMNTANQTVDGKVREAGITTIPFATFEIHEFPGATAQPFCIDYTPALKEGYEITAHVCGTYDASTLDWQSQYRQHNFLTEGEMLAFWANQSKERVSAAVKGVDYTTITTNRDSVSLAIRNNLAPWFKENGLPVSNIQLSNWDFTSASVKAKVDEASAASLQSTIEQQKLEAAKISRERQLYEIDTSNLVLSQRGSALQALFGALGITDDNAKAYLAAQMTWSDWLKNPPPGTTVVVGIGNAPVVAPSQPSAAPSAPLVEAPAP